MMTWICTGQWFPRLRKSYTVANYFNFGTNCKQPWLPTFCLEVAICYGLWCKYDFALKFDLWNEGKRTQAHVQLRISVHSWRKITALILHKIAWLFSPWCEAQQKNHFSSYRSLLPYFCHKCLVSVAIEAFCKVPCRYRVKLSLTLQQLFDDDFCRKPGSSECRFALSGKPFYSL